MPTPAEKAAFSQRLELALHRSQGEDLGPTTLALRFNLRHTGREISVQTAHKWLSGRTIPIKDKLATFSKWLDVDEHWLHYGSSTSKEVGAKDRGSKVAAPSAETIELAQKIQSLSSHRRYLLEELVNPLQAPPLQGVCGESRMHSLRNFSLSSNKCATVKTARVYRSVAN